MNDEEASGPDHYNTALTLLREALKAGNSLPEISNIWNAKDRVINRYSKVFSPNNLSGLTQEEYYEFLRFENNGHWSSLSRAAKSAGNDIEALRSIFRELLNESLPLVDRINNTFGIIPGLSRAVLTPILMIVYPDKYGVWNTPAEAALKQMKLWPVTTGLSQGEIYEKINEVFIKIARDLQIDLWTLDSLWWFIVRQQESAEMALGVFGGTDNGEDNEDTVENRYIEEELKCRLPETENIIQVNLSPEASIWKVAPGEQGRLWSACKNGGYICGGWSKLGQLKTLSKEAYFAKREKVASADERYGSRDLQPWQFVNELKVGDRVIANKGIGEILGMGTIVGPYYFESNADYEHRYPVQWDAIEPFQIEPIRNWRSTLMSVSRDQYREIIAQCPQFNNRDDLDVPKTPNPYYSISDALTDLFIEEDFFQEIIGLLRVKKNVILQGAPGVGKTFVARRLAYALMEEQDDSRIEFVQFHQSYSYEDFIQGFRPKEEGGFSLKDGVFFRFCKLAERDPQRPYVFIIDEINRGNLSKIFGELLMLLESDKRGSLHAMPLLYSDSRNIRFHVPDNVHILGMMNTADRSLAMVDYALRRRFAFVGLLPGFKAAGFRKYLETKGADSNLVNHIIAQMVRLNAKIAEDTANLGQGFCIGHSFFTPARNIQPSVEWFARVIQHEIEPLLREYYIDKEEEVSSILRDLRGDFC